MVVDGAVVMVENIIRHLSHVRRDTQSGGPVKTTAEMIREACHEVQRPVFYAIAIIITAYLPIFTLQRVEGRLFRPMAWTVAFALLCAMTFSILIAPVLAATFFRKGVRERRNLVMEYLTERYRRRLRVGPSNTVGSSLVRGDRFRGWDDLFGLWRRDWCGIFTALG